MSVTSPPLLETSTAADLSAGSENIFALMSVAIASSLGAPIREQETLRLKTSSKTKICILFLRISSSIFGIESRLGRAGQPEVPCPPIARPRFHTQLLMMHQTAEALPLIAFCAIQLRIAMQHCSQSHRRAGCIQGDECRTLVAPKMQDGEARESLSVLAGLVKR